MLVYTVGLLYEHRYVSITPKKHPQKVNFSEGAYPQPLCE